MKISYTLIIALIFNFGLNTQAQNFSLTFEDTSVINQVFYTDSTLDPNGIWQIGLPNKPSFNSAFSQPNAIVTVLDSTMPPNTMASFIVSLPNGLYYPDGDIITFAHKFAFDSAHGGGYVEFSVDSGQHWHGVFTSGLRGVGHYHYQGLNKFCVSDQGDAPIYLDGQYFWPPSWWGIAPSDTTSSGIAYFTGTDSAWIFDTIVIPTGIPYKTTPQNMMMFKFTAFTDSLSAPSSGWMIDNINYKQGVMLCLGGINEINSAHLHVYPDPATDEFFVSLLNEPENDYELTLYDLSGRVVMRTSFTGQEITMRRDGLDAGSYLIQVMDRRTQNTFQKRIVFQ